MSDHNARCYRNLVAGSCSKTDRPIDIFSVDSYAQPELTSISQGPKFFQSYSQASMSKKGSQALAKVVCRNLKLIWPSSRSTWLSTN